MIFADSASTLAEIRELSRTNPALVEKWAQGVEDTLAAAMQRKGAAAGGSRAGQAEALNVRRGVTLGRRARRQ